MSGEAIHEDVSEFGGDRLARMKEISQRRNDDEGVEDDDPMAVMKEHAEQLNQELAEADEEYNGEKEAEPTELPSGEDDEPEEEDELEGDDDPEDEQPGKLYTLKINGEEKQYTEEQVLAIAQKQEAADARLQEASRRIREIEQREAELEARASSQPSAQDVGNQESSEELKKMSREYHEALLDGDDERADELLIQIQNAGRQQPTQTIDPDQLANEVYQKSEQLKAAKERQAQVEAAQNFFKEEYGDIAGNPNLYNLADQITARLMQENPSLSPMELVTAAGDEVRETIGANKVSRTERKKKATGGMRGSNARKAGKPQPKAKTRADVLNDMRAGRGAPVI